MSAQQLTIVIIDDEEDARSTLGSMLKMYCPNVSVLGEASDVATGRALLEKAQPDVVLLDIQLGDATGFDLLDQLRNPDFRVIFCTAFDTFALKAIKYAALDYLIKPIDPTELIQAIHKALAERNKTQLFQQQLRQLLEVNKTKSFDKLTLNTSEGLVFLNLEDLVYLQSDVNYTLFFTKKEERIITSKPLKEYEAILPPEHFCRCHQSYIIHTRYIKKVLREDGGYALLENGEKIPISRRKKEALIQLLRS